MNSIHPSSILLDSSDDISIIKGGARYIIYKFKLEYAALTLHINVEDCCSITLLKCFLYVYIKKTYSLVTLRTLGQVLD